MASMNPAQLENQLKGVIYPVSKAELMKHVERNGADENIRMAISSLPNQTYDSFVAVSRTMSAMQQGSMSQEQDRNHRDQSQQGKQKASR